MARHQRLALGMATRLQVRREERRHTLEHLHRQGRGEFEVLRRNPRHIGGEGAEMAVADVEHKGRGAVDRLGTDDPPAGANGFDAIVAGAGLATHR